MTKYEILLKDGTIVEAESKWLTITTIESLLDDHKPFIQIGDTAVAKDAIAVITKIGEEKTEKEEEVF